MGYPTVTADQAFKVLHDSHLHELAAGQVVDGELAAYLAATGAPVSVTSAASDESAPVKPVEKMNAKELKAYADSLDGLDLGGAKTKAEVLAAVTAHLEAAAAGDGSDEQKAAGADGVTGDGS